MQFQSYANLTVLDSQTFSVDLIFDTGTQAKVLNYAPIIVQYSQPAVYDAAGTLVSPATPDVWAPRFDLTDQATFEAQLLAWVAGFIASETPAPAPAQPSFTAGTPSQGS